MEGLVKECYDAVSRINDEIWCEYDDLYSKGVNVLNKIPTLHLTTDTANVSIFLYIEDDKLILQKSCFSRMITILENLMKKRMNMNPCMIILKRCSHE